MLFATLPLERQPLQWGELPNALLVWTQNAGGVAAVGLFLWWLARVIQREPILSLSPSVSAERRSMLTNLFLGGLLVSVAGYLMVLFVGLGRILNMQTGMDSWFPRRGPDQNLTMGDHALLISGAFALVLVTAPILYSAVARIRCGRILAIARLSWKEAIRGRIVWVFGAIVLVFLFADWFVSYKPEHQVRTYVRVVYWSITPLFLLMAGMLGAFSIPTDVRNNSIHTITTKPVEKFEIVLGRFLGYAALLTVGLFVVACLSLVYVVRGVTEEAKQESYKARVALYGKLHFAGTKDPKEAQSIGREYGYRTYITGPTRRQRDPSFQQFAIWDFAEVPADLAQQPTPIPFEFAFDIFRLSKGEEGKGVFCTFTFADGMQDVNQLPGLVDLMNQDRNKLESEARKKFTGEELAKEYEKVNQELIAKYNLYQTSQEVTDFHTQALQVPPDLFRVLATTSREPRKDRLGQPAPMLRVFVNVNLSDQPQMVGVSKQDLYLLVGERPFWQNFLKGMIGLWCTHMLVLGVAVACSTYLSGVISLLCTLFLFGAGMFSDYLREIAGQQLSGGGPTQSLVRVAMNMPGAQGLEDIPATGVLQTIDQIFGWWMGRFMNLVPDVNRHDLHVYVANGYDIGWLSVVLLDNLVPLFGYLVLWAILAYYLMNYREIANPS